MAASVTESPTRAQATPSDPVAPADLVESIIVADLGRGSSRAYLLEQIGGSVRFVAKAEGPTTADLPFEDVTIGWRRLLGQIEWDTGRRLTEHDGLLMPQQERGDGVDALLVCSTLGEPLRVAVIEPGGGSISGSLIEALTRSYVRLMHIVTPTRLKDASWGDSQVGALRNFRPDVVVLLASGDPALTNRVLRVIRQTVSESVGWASSSGAGGGIEHAFIVADAATLERTNGLFGKKTKTEVLPLADRAADQIISTIEQRLADSFRQRGQTPDFNELARHASVPAMVRPRAVDLVNRFVARAFGRRVITIGIDDGTHVHWATAAESAMATLPGLDLGPMIGGLSTVEVADAARWLPFPVTEEELVTWVLNRAIRPWGVPRDPRDILIERALARQVARRALAEIARGHPLALSGADLLIGGPIFAHGDSLGGAALALLDSVDVVPNEGVIDLALDQDGLMAVAGTVGALGPSLAADLFELDGLVHLGSAVVIGGATHDGDLACRGELRDESGEATSFSVASGSLELIPLRPGETAALTLRPERRFSVGGHSSGKPVTLAGERRIIGGAVGVIIDARGRSLATGAKDRPTKVKQWLDAVSGGKQAGGSTRG